MNYCKKHNEESVFTDKDIEVLLKDRGRKFTMWFWNIDFTPEQVDLIVKSLIPIKEYYNCFDDYLKSTVTNQIKRVFKGKRYQLNNNQKSFILSRLDGIDKEDMDKLLLDLKI